MRIMQQRPTVLEVLSDAKNDNDMNAYLRIL